MSYDLCPPPQLILTIGLFWAVLYNTRSVCKCVCVWGGVLQCEVWNPTTHPLTHSPYGTPLLTCPLLGKSDPQSNPFPSQAGGQYCYTLDTPHTHTHVQYSRIALLGLTLKSMSSLRSPSLLRLYFLQRPLRPALYTKSPLILRQVTPLGPCTRLEVVGLVEGEGWSAVVRHTLYTCSEPFLSPSSRVSLVESCRATDTQRCLDGGSSRVARGVAVRP